MSWIFGGKFSVNFSQEKCLTFVTENFTTFVTARKEICHMELTLGASSPKKICIWAPFVPLGSSP